LNSRVRVPYHSHLTTQLHHLHEKLKIKQLKRIEIRNVDNNLR